MANFGKFGRKRLGEILVNEGLVSRQQIDEALAAQGNAGELLGETLVRLGHITEDRIASTLVEQLDLPFIIASSYDIPKEMAKLIPVQYMLDHLFVPLDQFGNVLVIAIAGLLNEEVVGEIKRITGGEVFPYISTMGDVRKALERLYPHLFQLGPDQADVRGIGYTQAIGHTQGLEYESAEEALDGALPEGGVRPASGPSGGVPRATTRRAGGVKPVGAKGGNSSSGKRNSGNSGNSKKGKSAPPRRAAGGKPVAKSTAGGTEEDDSWESLFDDADESVRRDLGE